MSKQNKSLVWDAEMKSLCASSLWDNVFRIMRRPRHLLEIHWQAAELQLYQVVSCNLDWHAMSTEHQTGSKKQNKTKTRRAALTVIEGVDRRACSRTGWWLIYTSLSLTKEVNWRKDNVFTDVIQLCQEESQKAKCYIWASFPSKQRTTVEQQKMILQTQK